MEIKGSTVIGILIVVFFILIFIDRELNVKDIKKNGIEITAIVKSCQKELIRKGRGNSMIIWISRAYFTVDGERYYNRIKAIVPIGTEVKIRYAPRNPMYNFLIDPHQFDNYPKEMEEDNKR